MPTGPTLLSTDMDGRGVIICCCRSSCAIAPRPRSVLASIRRKSIRASEAATSALAARKVRSSRVRRFLDGAAEEAPPPTTAAAQNHEKSWRPPCYCFFPALVAAAARALAAAAKVGGAGG